MPTSYPTPSHIPITALGKRFNVSGSQISRHAHLLPHVVLDGVRLYHPGECEAALQADVERRLRTRTAGRRPRMPVLLELGAD